MKETKQVKRKYTGKYLITCWWQDTGHGISSNAYKTYPCKTVFFSDAPDKNKDDLNALLEEGLESLWHDMLVLPSGIGMPPIQSIEIKNVTLWGIKEAHPWEINPILTSGQLYTKVGRFRMEDWGKPASKED